MKQEILAVILALLVVGSLGVGYFAGSQMNFRTSTSTSTAFVSATSTFITTQTSTLTSTETLPVYDEAPIPLSTVETGNVSTTAVSMFIDPYNSGVYLTYLNSTTMTVLDASTFRQVANVDLPSQTYGVLALDSANDTLYVVYDGGIAVVDGATNSIIKEFSTEFSAVAYNPTLGVYYAGQSQSVQASSENPPVSLLEVSLTSRAVVANVTISFSPVGPGFGGIYLDQSTNMVYLVGCDQMGLVCDSMVSVINGTSGRLVATDHLGSGYYPNAVLNPQTITLYVTGASQLDSIDGYSGSIIYAANPQTCGPFIGMDLATPSDQIVVAPQNYNYILMYDGSTLALVNMYSLPASPAFVTYDPGNNQIYVLLQEPPATLVSFHNVSSEGHVNNTLIGDDQNCPLP
jgi:hypothetical protein